MSIRDMNLFNDKARQHHGQIPSRYFCHPDISSSVVSLTPDISSPLALLPGHIPSRLHIVHMSYVLGKYGRVI